MLNIPNDVKNLFKLDSCRKNFRIHFPNGEMNDLTNDNLVQESVEFSESICSQNTFKFGKSESSTIEFETVGVPNIMGMKIECGIEVDCTSLTAAQVSAIEAGSWDGYYKSANESDIGYSFFHVPYGLFVVRSCPRDHQAMTHRKVTAYTDTRLLTTDYQTALLDAKGFEKKYTPKFQNVFYASVSRNNEALLLDAGYTRTVHSLMSDITQVGTSDVRQFGNMYFKITVRSKKILMYSGNVPLEYYGYNPYTADALYAIDGFENIKNENLVDSIASVMVSEYNVPDEEAYNYEVYNNIAKVLTFSDATPSNPKSFSMTGLKKVGVDYGIIQNKGIDITGSINGFYCISPDREGMLTLIDVISEIIAVPWSGSDASSGYAIGDPIVSSAEGLEDAYFNQYTAPSGTEFSTELNLGFTGHGKAYNVYGTPEYYTFSGAIDFSNLSVNYLEVNALFAAQNRLGGYKFFNLDDTADATLLPAEYSHFWWDEYDVSPIGKIKYVYKKKDKEETLIYDFGDGQSMYDMTANDFFNQLQKSQSEIESILSSSFVPHAGVVAFTPIELTVGNGLPYLEAGDCIEAVAEDLAVAKSYILTQRISGIQHLIQEIESSGGNLTGTAYEEGSST